ncbi:porin [Salinarimonas rosea]|uniref:porin n=1 Tax=Salinarimonas rosea TaxID=552063 RepID=UPI0003F844F2|nr:porin [Salinarimonas rosea]
MVSSPRAEANSARRKPSPEAPTTADLPVRAAAPVDYVRTCPNAPIGGTGFFVIPGTETCLQISGYVRVDYRFQEQDERTIDRREDDVEFFARGSIAFDARTPTEYGTLRSFIRINADSSLTRGSAGWAANSATTNERTWTASSQGQGAALDQAFIQFAGLTAGRITSFFSFWGGNMMSVNNGVSDPSTEVLAYTATFGSGFSATVSIENGVTRREGIGDNTALIPAGQVPLGYGGQELPDLVANLNVAQAWGSAQVMGALHQVRHNQPVAVDDEMGWAIGAGVNIRLPMIAAGDALWLQATYADGAVDYVNPPTTVSEFGLRARDANANTVNGVTSLDTTQAWSVAAGFRHFWTPAFWQDIQGAYGEVENEWFRAAVPASVANNSTQDYTWWQLGTALNWRPVTGLLFRADVVYTQVDTDIPVQLNNWTAANNLIDDEGSRWVGRLRIQRDF